MCIWKLFKGNRWYMQWTLRNFATQKFVCILLQYCELLILNEKLSCKTCILYIIWKEESEERKHGKKLKPFIYWLKKTTRPRANVDNTSIKMWKIRQSLQITSTHLRFWKRKVWVSMKSFKIGLFLSMEAVLRQFSTALLTVEAAVSISSAVNLCSIIPKGPGCSTFMMVSTSCSSCL